MESQQLNTDQLSQNTDQKQWFVLRDLSRSNVKRCGYMVLADCGVEVFTPFHWVVSPKARKQVQKPIVHDLLFAYSTRKALDPILTKVPFVQYRYVRGGSYCQAMVVPNDDMERFKYAVSVAQNPKYYLPEQINSQMVGKAVRIVGGELCGYQGNLLAVKGRAKKRLIVCIPSLIAVGVEVGPEYIQFIE